MNVLKEAQRLYGLGFAVIWLRPKSKMPVESGWTTGPRASWNHLRETYRNGYNVGTRLGSPARIAGHHLAVVDLDIKSTRTRHRKEALAAVRKIIGEGTELPVVLSGRGNGSRHYYCLTAKPFKTVTPARSADKVRVHMPSKKPSKAELAELSEDDIKNGWRLSPAWEVALYSDGRQVVLPPSVHPDTGEEYVWEFPIDGEIPVLELVPDTDTDTDSKPKTKSAVALDVELDFKACDVDLDWLEISEAVREGIRHGTGVTDRSGYLLQASTALLSAGLTENEVLSVLTDPDTFLGAVGYDHAKTKSRKRAAEWVYKYTLRRVADERSPEKVFNDADFIVDRKLSAEEMEKQTAELLGPKNWKDDLERKGKYGEGRIEPTVGNVTLIFKNAVGPDIMRRDLFALRDSYGCKTPWGAEKNQVVSDDDGARIKYWLGQTYGFEPGKDVIFDALTEIAHQNAFDPVKDAIEKMLPWDKVPRLDTWLRKYFEAEGDPEYLAQVFRKWMCAMVLRTYQPGAKFDWMPIFEGAQGVGKSSFGRILVGDQFFLDWLPSLADKDSALALQGIWAVELGELSQFRKNELETIKAFITRTVDKVRPPFGRKTIEVPRRCVFFGTTNREEYLMDDTGNRRFKPVKVGALNFKALKRDRTQLFAEAKWLLDHGKESERTLELDAKTRVFEARIHQEKMVQNVSDLMVEKLTNFFDQIRAENDPEFDLKKFHSISLFGVGGPLSDWPPDNKNFQAAASALRKMGAIRRSVKGRQLWNFEKNT